MHLQWLPRGHLQDAAKPPGLRGQEDGVPAQQVVQRAQVDHEHDRIDDGQTCDHDQPRFVGAKTVRNLRRRVVLAQFDANSDDDLSHQRDDENDAGHPAIALPRSPLYMVGDRGLLTTGSWLPGWPTAATGWPTRSCAGTAGPVWAGRLSPARTVLQVLFDVEGIGSPFVSRLLGQRTDFGFDRNCNHRRRVGSHCRHESLPDFCL